MTLPRNVTKTSQDVHIFRVPQEEVEIPLTEGEHLVSNVFAIETTGMFAVRPLSAPAMLEIRCDIRESVMAKFKFSHLRMVQYDPEEKIWKDVEKIEIFPQRYCEFLFESFCFCFCCNKDRFCKTMSSVVLIVTSVQSD